MTPAQTSLIILVVVMVCYITEIVPLAVTAVGSCAAAVFFKVVPASIAWSGLSSDTNLLIAGMIVVGLALFETGLAEKIGKTIVSVAGTGETKLMIAIMLVTMALSGFLNNTATTAMMVPVLAGIIVTSGGKIHEKFVMMPLALSAVSGGMLTLVGSTPTVIVQGVHTAAGLPAFGFFEFALVGAPICLGLFVYNFTIGRWLAVKMYGANPEHSDYMLNMTANAASPGEEVERDKTKMAISGLILAGCVTGFILTNTKVLPLGTIAMIGALACVVTGCISEKATYRQMDWTTVLVLGGSIGFAAALDKSGGGKLLADAVINFFGDAITPFILMAAIAFIGMFLTQFMSNTA
ncbi:MAG: SLC13 family permease, partial [Syntrophomonas sp.]|nr:SLC13 family permease [Syntrophomonas sp.]